MSALKNLVGQRFGRLVVLERAGSTKHKKALWRCKCDCGNETIVCGSTMLKGETKSCGCITKENAILLGEKNIKHGQRNAIIYHIWRGIKSRCFNKNDPCYEFYGKKGITVCEKWRNSFQAFYDWALANGYKEETLLSGKSKLSIDRIDNNGNYCPENCRWATYKEQARNRTNNLWVTYKNETLTLAEWCEKLKLPYDRTQRRLYKGMSFEKAIQNVDYRRVKYNIGEQNND
jgi:hypothetical protein